MGIKDTRKMLKLAKYSRAVTIPTKLKTGEYATLAGDRLILMDPRGEISPDELLDFLEKFIEPNLWGWLQERKESIDV